MENNDHPEYRRALQAAAKRYRCRQALHVAVLLLYLAVVVGRPVLALAQSGLLRGERGVPLLLMTAAFFAVPVLLYCWYIRLYQRGIRRVAKGDLLVLSGVVTERRKARITVRETLPPGMNPGAWQHLTREHPFRLPPAAGTIEPRPGDQVTLWYPADRILWAGTPTAVWIRLREESETAPPKK